LGDHQAHLPGLAIEKPIQAGFQARAANRLRGLTGTLTNVVINELPARAAIASRCWSALGSMRMRGGSVLH
jgi:hypothetical protein